MGDPSFRIRTESALKFLSIKVRKKLINLLLLLITTISALLVVEMIIRVFDIGPQISSVFNQHYKLSKNQSLRYELKPNLKDKELQINSHGMRNKESSIEKPKGTYRIAIIGDSIAFGLGVKRDQTFSSKLERLLNKYFSPPGVSFEVLNFGVTGYSVTQIMENVRVRTLKFDPDLLIYAYCLNDPQEYSLEMENLLADMTQARKDYWDKLSMKNQQVLSHSRTFLLIQYLIRSKLEPKKPRPILTDDPQFEALDNDKYVNYYSNLHESEGTWSSVIKAAEYLNSVSKAYQIPIFVVIFPLLNDLDDYPLCPVHEKLSSEFQTRSIDVLDLLELFSLFEKRKKGEIALDALHPTEKGHSYTAVSILYFLLQKQIISGQSVQEFQKRLNVSKSVSEYAVLVESVLNKKKRN